MIAPPPPPRYMAQLRLATPRRSAAPTGNLAAGASSWHTFCEGAWGARVLVLAPALGADARTKESGGGGGETPATAAAATTAAGMGAQVA